MSQYINKDKLEQYKVIYKEYYGIELDDTEAYRQGISLINLISALIKHINNKDKDKKNGSIQKNKD